MLAVAVSVVVIRSWFGRNWREEEEGKGRRLEVSRLIGIWTFVCWHVH